jgi:hypothetical protein
MGRHPKTFTLSPWPDAARPVRPNRGFLPWRFSDAGPECAVPSVMGRHPKTFTFAD